MEMIEYCDLQIRDGVMDPAKIFNKHRNTTRLLAHAIVRNRHTASKQVHSLIQSKQFPIIEGFNDFDDMEEWCED